MARRTGILTAIIREAARAQRQAQQQAETERRRQQREAVLQLQARARENLRRVREAEKRQALATKEARQQLKEAEKAAQEQYLQSQLEEAEQRTKELNDRIQELKEILDHTLSINDAIAFESLRLQATFPPFSPPKDLMTPLAPPQPPALPPAPQKNTSLPPAPQREKFYAGITPPGPLARVLFGGTARYERELREAEKTYQKALLDYAIERQQAEERYQRAVLHHQRTVREQKERHQEEQKKYQALITARKERLAKLRREHEQEKLVLLRKAQQRNEEIKEFEVAYRAGDPTAIITYNTMVLERSQYPNGFPQEFSLAYVPESKQLVVEYQLPTAKIVPVFAEIRYVKARDTFEKKPRKPTEIKDLYQDVVAAITLRTIHESLEADQNHHLETVVFNGFVHTVDPATGKDVRPHLISTRATRQAFLNLNLSCVDKRQCLRNLGSQVSPQPTEMVAVKPIVDFNMVDKRFVEGAEILGNLDGRPNLMDLNPFEFEQLVHDLFAKQGLETKLTRSSRDGGVDVVAFDKRPILGGKVVIQAKRYRHTVGVSAVRDLYGTMMSEGANKGILVTTSGYGPDAFKFAKDKPIELIEGGGLLYLLEQVGVKARIVFPAEE